MRVMPARTSDWCELCYLLAASVELSTIAGRADLGRKPHGLLPRLLFLASYSTPLVHLGRFYCIFKSRRARFSNFQKPIYCMRCCSWAGREGARMRCVVVVEADTTRGARNAPVPETEPAGTRRI